MPNLWNFGPNGPKTTTEFRQAMKDKIKTKNGKELISSKFTKDHIFAGHAGSDLMLATKLSKLRGIAKSTLLISSLDSHAKNEVLNWIDNIPDSKLSHAGGTWTISTQNSSVAMVSSYKFVTVDMDQLSKMNRDDLVKKSRKYMKYTYKTPKLACQFSNEGIPQIYHLDY